MKKMRNVDFENIFETFKLLKWHDGIRQNDTQENDTRQDWWSGLI